MTDFFKINYLMFHADFLFLLLILGCSQNDTQRSYFERLNGHYPLAFLAYFLRVFRVILVSEEQNQSGTKLMAEIEFKAIFVAVLLKYKVSVLGSAFVAPVSDEIYDFKVENWAYSIWDVIELFRLAKSASTPRIFTLITWFHVS